MGRGGYPSSWQGWLVLFLYLVVIVLDFISVDQKSHSVSDTLIGVFLPFVVFTIILIVICYRTGEKPRWRGG